MRTVSGSLAMVLVGALAAILVTSSGAFTLPTLKPSNADTAFRQVPLLSPSGGTDYVTGVGHSTWPTFLDSSALVWPIGGGDSILIASTRTQGVTVGLNGSVTYTFPPNTFANRVGAIVTANDWTNSLESTLPLLIASFTLEDGRTWGDGSLYDVNLNRGYPFLLYYRVRNWSDQVVPGNPNFVAHPLNAAVFQLCAQASNGGVGNVYSDLQTFTIPDSLRNTALRTVTFASHTTAFDSTHVTSAHALVTGCAVWPQFHIANRLGEPIGVIRQDVGAWADSAYGGYYYQGALIGTDGTISENGCALTCMAMIHNYLHVDGASMTPDQLNHWLQTHQGYDRYGEVVVDSVVSQAVGADVHFQITPDSAAWRTGDHAVVEIQRYTRAAFELQVTQLFASVPNGPATHGRATITRAFEAVSASGGLPAHKYGNINQMIASMARSLGSANPWAFDTTGQFGPTAAKAERALADSLPIMLAVNQGGHYVVGEGRRAGWPGGLTSKGTYAIGDPLAGLSTLGAGYANVFNAALYVKPTLSQHMPVPYIAAASAPEDGVSILAYGPMTASIQDPSGNTITVDPATGSYVSTIPGALAIRGVVTGKPGVPSTQSGQHDVFYVPQAAAGAYVVVLTADNTGDVGLYSASYSPTRDTYATRVSASAAAGQRKVFQLNFDATTRAVSLADVTAVESLDHPVTLRLAVMPNPARGSVGISWGAPRAGTGTVAVYDVLGRRVALLLKGRIESGAHSLTWAGMDDAGHGLSGGLYFVRFTGDAGTVTARVILLGGL